MHAKVFSATTIGVGAHIVEVEVDLSVGLMNFFIVGLPDKAIKESKDRVKSALKNSGFSLPERSVTVNLAPANLKKQDVLFDLPIAIALLRASRLLSQDELFFQETLFLGELALDGILRPVCGVLSVVDFARKKRFRRVIVPQENSQEASLIKDIAVIGVRTLSDVVAFIRGEKKITPEPCRFTLTNDAEKKGALDISDVRGQFIAKRALLVAAAGNHNLLFVGPPGSGKTMLAKRLATLMPPLSFHEVIEITKIYSVAGLLDRVALVTQRPFRAPHHTISAAGLVGGGSIPRPGEVTLSHNGVLFLDELTEFRRATLEVLRQPLESKRVLISRAQMALEFPSSFLLVAALNPCPCGYFGDQQKKCTCSPKQIRSYISKISGPLLDRIDLQIGVQSVKYDDSLAPATTTSHDIRTAVIAARAIQQQRGQNVDNGQLHGKSVEQYCQLTTSAQACIKTIFDKMKLSMRGYHKLLKIARTLADLESADLIDEHHIQEALLYRSLDSYFERI